MNERRPRISLNDSINSLGFTYEQPSPARSPNLLMWAIAFGLMLAILCLVLFVTG